MKQNKIFILGLTGSIGSGKSTISKMIKEASIPVIDADIIAREVLIKYPNIIEEIKSKFGEQYFDDNGNLQRKKLGELIFKDSNKKNQLEDIIMPYIKKDIFMKIKEYDSEGCKLCVVDAPTLIENNLHFFMNAIILVTVDRDLQIERIKKRDLLDEEEIMNRINNQMSQEEKIKYADYVINNNSSIEDAKNQLFKILESLN